MDWGLLMLVPTEDWQSRSNSAAVAIAIAPQHLWSGPVRNAPAPAPAAVTTAAAVKEPCSSQERDGG